MRKAKLLAVALAEWADTFDGRTVEADGDVLNEEMLCRELREAAAALRAMGEVVEAAEELCNAPRMFAHQDRAIERVRTALARVRGGKGEG